MSQASLAFRKNETAIRAGEAPEKYTRLLPHIPGQRILEVGSAEGVLALLLAKQGKQVTALEANADRHEAAIELCLEWQGQKDFAPPRFVNGRLGARLDLLDNIDTFVAVRMIYYLRDEIDWTFRHIAAKVPVVVLCGNRNRAHRYYTGTIPPDDGLGRFNYYASVGGMEDILKRHGYKVKRVVREGDPIVVGRK